MNPISILVFDFFSLMTMTLVLMKLSGMVTWSWIWIFSPIWIAGWILIIAIVIAEITIKILIAQQRREK